MESEHILSWCFTRFQYELAGWECLWGILLSAWFLICKNINWVINSAVAMHEDSFTETDQEHVACACLEFHSVLVSSCNLDILFHLFI